MNKLILLLLLTGCGGGSLVSTDTIRNHLDGIDHNYSVLGCPMRYWATTSDGRGPLQAIEIPTNLLNKAKKLIGKDATIVVNEKAFAGICSADRVAIDIY